MPRGCSHSSEFGYETGGITTLLFGLLLVQPVHHLPSSTVKMPEKGEGVGGVMQDPHECDQKHDDSGPTEGFGIQRMLSPNPLGCSPKSMYATFY